MADCVEELLFFDTFAHDITEEINLDLVQFPKPVYVTEVRIIPLGARVQADFPGGVRLGATNPSQFEIEFFVNDLGKPGASTFEALGAFEYDQNGKINLECAPDQAVRRIPTDGLVLKGLYTTITLAVYGTLTNSLAEQLVPPIVNPTLPSQPNTIADAQQICAAPEAEWAQDAQGEYQGPAFQAFPQAEPYQYPEYYADVPKDPRSYHQEAEWEKVPRPRERYQEREHSERKGRYARSDSRERGKERHDRERVEEWDRHGGRRHEDGAHRRYEKEERKRPRSPPVHSPKRPHSPKEAAQPEATSVVAEVEAGAPPKAPAVPEKAEEPPAVEEFEPILSDEDIVDDSEQFAEPEFDYTAYTNNDDIIRQFVPGVTELRQYAPRQRWAPDGRVDEELSSSIAIADDYFKSSIRRFRLESFQLHNTAIKEEFVHLCEKLPEIIGEAGLLNDLMGVCGHAPQSEEVAAQAAFVVESVTDWLAIGLDFGMANQQEQPAYKIRHIKCGVRLAALISASEPFLQHLWRIEFNLHDALLSLYAQDFMALSIQLLVLQALNAYLLHRDAVARFLAAAGGGYGVIMRAVAEKRQVRQTFALACILRKLNLYECLQELRALLEELRREEALSPQNLLVVAQALHQVLHCCRAGPFAMEQPRRFLPVSAQFELPRIATPQNIPVRYFDMAGLLQGFLLLLASPSTLNLPAIKSPVLDVLATLLEGVEGVRYLSRHAPTANALLKCLLRPEDDELQYGETLEAHSHQLGLQLAYKLQALYLVDALRHLAALDCDAGDVVDHLHQLLCLTFAPVGRQCVGEVLAMGDHAVALLQFLRTAPSAESPGAEYIVDLLYVAVVLVGNVPFLERFSGRIREALALVGAPALSGRVSEVRSYLLDCCPLSGNHVAVLLGKVQDNLDGTVASPGPVVGALRALHHLGVAPQVQGGASDPLTHFVELKYKHAILELFSLDGSTVLTRLLHKLCAHFDQPGVHSSIFASTQGLLLANTIQPALALLQEMLAHVIQCRGTEFKDLTAVPVLLKTYTLLDSFPASCAATGAAQRCKMAVVDALLHYTQPVSDDESLSKTLWAQMVGEALRYVTSAPCTFVAGLLVLSELLPLPLPLPLHASHALQPDVRPWLLNLRKLWAAHLLPHSALVQEMIGKLCISTQPQLLNLLRRICVQIADLAAGAALMVARGFLDLVLGGLEPRPCSSHVARLLNFLACLVTHGAIKCAVLHLVGVEDKYAALLPAFAHVLQLPDRAPSHVQAQDCVLSILQSFCDVELALLQSNGVARDVYLANALPGKEHVIGIVALLLDHLGAESAFVTCLPVVRTLLLLTEHDYGFFHLRDALLRRDAPFGALLAQLVKATPSPEALSTLNILVEFLRLCAAVEEGDAHPRTIVLSGAELRLLVGWTEDTPHALTLLEEMLQKQTEDEETGLEAILEGLAQLLKQLRLGEEGPQAPPLEVHLPGAGPLLAQYEGREVFSAAGACDDRLTARYWLATPPEESDADIETVACDLFEICRQLPPEYNLIKGVEKLCRISRTDPPPSDKAAKHAEEERSRARKPFITPMRPRGFPRTAPQRPDLFRSRPPNTSRPPSLHVDDFLALETCGAQPTGPTGYNKLSREILASSRMARAPRGRAFVPAERSVQYSRHMAWWAGPNRGAGSMHGPYF